MKFKLISGFLKFYLTYAFFGMFAIFIIYASADVLLLVQTGQSYLLQMIFDPDTVSDEKVKDAVVYFIKVSFDSIPGEAYFEDAFGLAIDGANGNVFTFVLNVSQDYDMISSMRMSFVDYAPNFLRDISITSLSTFVFFAVVHFKDIVLKTNSISVFLGFIFASFFWLLAGYTFGGCLVSSLELIVDTKNRIVLYIVLIMLAIGLEALIHAFANKCSVFRLLALSILKIFFSVVKVFFVWYMCRNVSKAIVFEAIPALLILATLFIFFSIAEVEMSKRVLKK